VQVLPLTYLVAGCGFFLALLAYPLWRRYPDDQGDGMALVLIPPPRVPRLWRVPVFVTLFIVLFVLYRSITGPLQPDQVYKDGVIRLASTVISAPSEMNAYLYSFTLGLRFLIWASIVCIAVVGRGNPVRRLMVAFNSVWYILAMLFIDSLLLVIEIRIGLPVQTGILIGNFFAVGLAFVAMGRTLFANYCLPKPTAVPFVPRPRFSDNATIIAVTLIAMAICAAGFFFVFYEVSARYRSALALVLPVPFAETTIILRGVLLGILAYLTRQPEPAIGDERPPIDVIIPAYNEEEVIQDTLLAIEVAAARYGGRIRVILLNDGSVDRTKEVAQAIFAGYRHATGQVVDGRHGGKSESLNAALAHATTDIVVRIDADTVVGEDCFYYTARWFRDPSVGLVEAMMFPRYPDHKRSLFPHMRLFEELKQFGFNHRTLQQVDGVNVVPGVYTAFRRQVAVWLGGFTVGMNGEDGDFTLRFSRMGYHSVLDPKVIVYEDVPPTYMEIREQRIRWFRAVHHNNARHGPYRAGFATPKVWYSQERQFFSRSFSPARLVLPIFLLLTAIFEGSYRNVILLFVGGYFFFTLVFMIFQTFLTIGYHQGRHIGWVLFWPFWQEMLTIFSVESWISMPGRPAGLHGARPVAVAGYVIH
jgi:cellulose synthase/poly-beta-1,6-N-acetylglucosamine synthase-like glycosyltransferase